MKRATKFTALLLIASLIFCMVTPLVHAEEAVQTDNRFSITIENSNKSHEFTAYQIFKGRVDTEQGRLSDVEWGKNIDTGTPSSTDPQKENKKGLIEDLKADSILSEKFKDVTDARSVARALEKIENDSQDAIRFAEIVSDYLKEEGTKFIYNESDNTHKAENLDGGFYLIKDTKEIANNNTSTRYILELNKNQKVKVKAGTTSVEKLVRRAGTEDPFKKAVSAEMGSEVEFQLTGTLPDNYADYSTYYYSFIDTLPKGLTYSEGSVHAKVYNKNTSNEESSTEEYQEIPIDDLKIEVKKEEQTVTFTINDLKTLDKNNEEGQKITKDSKIVLTFKAKVNENATIGKEGNTNKVKLEYSSNPNKGHDGEKTQTTEDEAKVYTYELEIEKKDKDKQEILKGVGFKIYKKSTKDDGTEEKLYAKSDGSKITGWVEDKNQATVFETKDEGKTNIKGLSSGVYYLTETKFLPRYDSIGDIEIKIEEKFGEDIEASEQLPETVQEKEELKSLTFTIKEIKDEDSEDTTESEKMVDSKDGTGSIEDCKISITIYNKKGSLLPKTGGIGTIIFYVLGIGLIILAVYLIYSKKKK